MTRRSSPGPRPSKGRPEGSTTDQRLLDSRGDGGWVHTDTWRVLKIQAEFVEGFNDLAVFGTMTVSSFASGALVSLAGWERMNVAALPFLVAVFAALAWFRRVRARPVAA